MEPDRSSGVPEGISPASSLMMAVHEADFDEPRRRSVRHRHGHRLERMTLKYMPGRDPNNETKQKLIIAASAVPGPKDRSGRAARGCAFSPNIGRRQRLTRRFSDRRRLEPCSLRSAPGLCLGYISRKCAPAAFPGAWCGLGRCRAVGGGIAMSRACPSATESSGAAPLSIAAIPKR
jgi:hypothetical protein